ncbi:unnamed protein product [Adineta steineri]|uniref:F-box domain-containing protein n=1 Tax=Adineta steineri TaxID=433720 RepID=A0A814UND7_9BILA|nr:unnamed protein product [Adineta steineri]CAF1177157.1 unnamed protein product [Adineta steineri]
MSIDRNSSLEILPVEILHRIFDNLDAQTILFSLRNTCRQLYAITKSYERYSLDCQSISKSDFDRLSRLIDARNVISLKLSNDDYTFNQIEIFLTQFNIHEFSRLRSLILIEIEEEYLEPILENINIHSLISFSLSVKKLEDQYRKKTAELLTSLVTQTNLLKLEVKTIYARLEEIVWPNQSTIRHLKIDQLITIDEICQILQSLPNLRILVIGHLYESASHQINLVRLSAPFRQVISLTVEYMCISIDDLELFLSLMPSLTYLKLISTQTDGHGNRWEQYIQTNLPFLTNFEFYFYIQFDYQNNVSDNESIITSYQTPFWINHKKWFVACEYSIDAPNSINVFSIPICLSSLTYIAESNKVLLSTFPTLLNNDVFIMDNITKLQLTISQSTVTNAEQQEMQINLSALVFFQ